MVVSMNNEMKKTLLYKMLEIRCFEEHVSRLKFSGELYGAVHCCIGQEAVSVGACTALRENDYIVGNHRSHGYMLAKGVKMKPLMAEMYGKKTGTNGGRGGSLHVNDASIRALGATGIVGSGIPIACGAAFASKYNEKDDVALVFFGDGACNEGTFHESLNLASVWKLPVIFLIENNGLAVTTPNTLTTSNCNLYERANAYNMPGWRIDGQNPEEVYRKVKDASEYAREGNGPVLIEAMTYRFHEHAEGKGYLRMEHVGYRDDLEKEDWIKHRDPVKLYEEKLLAEGIIFQEELNQIKKEILQNVEAADAFAKESDNPDVASVRNDLYFEGENS